MAEKGYITSISTNRPVPSGAFDMLIGRDRTFQKSVIVSSPDEFHFLAGHDETISQTIASLQLQASCSDILSASHSYTKYI